LLELPCCLCKCQPQNKGGGASGPLAAATPLGSFALLSSSCACLLLSPPAEAWSEAEGDLARGCRAATAPGGAVLKCTPAVSAPSAQTPPLLCSAMVRSVCVSMIVRASGGLL